MSQPSTRVFIVHDDPVGTLQLTAMLRVSGYAASSFATRRELLQAASANPPDLFLSTVYLPQISGMDLALDLKKICPGCKVLLFAGEASSIDFAKDATRVDHHFHLLPRPLLHGDILAAIRDQSLEN